MIREKLKIKNEYLFSIDDSISKLRSSSQNCKFTFLQRFIYIEDDPNVILGMAQKAVKKLKLMGIIVGDSEVQINREGLEKAKNNYNEGNYKFYTKPGTRTNCRALG